MWCNALQIKGGKRVTMGIQPHALLLKEIGSKFDDKL
jgi:hypothetical protein